MDTTILLDPKILGFWVKCIRETSHWSQEALAASSGLDVRTIQRVEAGKPASTTTRRALARGLGYDNPDVFDSPDFISSVYKILGDLNGTSQEAVEKQFPDHMRLRRTGCKWRCPRPPRGCLHWIGTPYGRRAERGRKANGLFDYLQDMQDIRHEVSFTDKLSYNQEMATMLADLEANGAIAYSAVRRTKIVGHNWVDKTPMPFTAVYITVVPAGREFKEVMVPRRLS